MIQINQVGFVWISLSAAGRREFPLAYPSRCATVWLVGIAITLTIVLMASGAGALVLTPFRYEDQAQRHCPTDTIVWLDCTKRKYYFYSQKLYGYGFHGSFVCLQEARRNLYRRSLLGRR